MKIVVCIKQVPDTTEVKIDPVTNNLVREGSPSIMNPFDESALAAALRLREKAGGTVTLVSMGPLQVRKELEKGLRMGADRAVLVSDRRLGGADTLATGYALAQTIERLGFDLVLCGNEAIDGCTGQVGPMIGEFLHIPAFTYVSSIETDGRGIRVCRRTEKWEETYRAEVPAVACLLKSRPDAEAVEKDSEKEIEIWNADYMDESRIGTVGSPTKVAAISVSERARNYLEVDYSWDLDKRMEYIFNGGLEVKHQPLRRGTKEKLAHELLREGWAEYDSL